MLSLQVLPFAQNSALFFQKPPRISQNAAVFSQNAATFSQVPLPFINKGAVT
jgi:hypothetical protein